MYNKIYDKICEKLKNGLITEAEAIAIDALALESQVSLSDMKGYYKHGDYMGRVPSECKYRRFETIDAYKEYFRDRELSKTTIESTLDEKKTIKFKK